MSASSVACVDSIVDVCKDVRTSERAVRGKFVLGVCASSSADLVAQWRCSEPIEADRSASERPRMYNRRCTTRKLHRGARALTSADVALPSSSSSARTLPVPREFEMPQQLPDQQLSERPRRTSDRCRSKLQARACRESVIPCASRSAGSKPAHA